MQLTYRPGFRFGRDSKAKFALYGSSAGMLETTTESSISARNALSNLTSFSTVGRDSDAVVNGNYFDSEPGSMNGVCINPSSVNGAHSNATSTTSRTAAVLPPTNICDAPTPGTTGTTNHTNATLEVPMPTANGGYSHTSASRAKISQANKGKTPWNKGKARSEEVRARIAAGVRARNRERFLQKLKDMGLTEEEYEQQKKEERRKKEAERRARRTEKGGYRPTDETKQKISSILKEKWAKGEIKKGPVDPTKVRRGFTHSEETRAKISESMRKRWAEDPEYRDNMIQKSHSSNTKPEVKQRISKALKEKWQDPEFRAEMIARMSQRRKPSGPHDMSHREKISAAMKAKWQDAEYRRKTIEGIQKRQNDPTASMQLAREIARTKAAARRAAKPRPKATVARKEPEEVDGVHMVRSLKPVQPKKKKVKKKKLAKRQKKIASSIVDADGNRVVARSLKKKKPQPKGSSSTVRSDAKQKKTVEANGSIQRLREERRDLYDLLYGDDSSSAAAAFELGDENLDTFDPYGLDDF